ncbi:MAG TPA: hypothetical protein VMW31_03195, partial [Devosiaceae bacterium]|nr:hypothetical protein [Devosiaceae bacterium]
MQNEEFGGNAPHWLFVIGALLILAAVTLLFAFNPSHMVGKIFVTAVGELGFALVIAYIIIAVVDRRQKEDFRTYVQRTERRLASRSLIAYLTDLEMSGEVSDELEQMLITSNFIKTTQLKRFELREENPAWIEFRTIADYVAYNASGSPSEFHFPFYLDRELDLPEQFQGRNGMIDFLAQIRRAQADKFVTKREDTFAAPLPQDSEDVNFKARLAPGEQVRIRNTVVTMKRCHDNEVWQNLFLAEKTRIEVVFDPAKMDI